ncbi:putative ABC transporter substrate-binding protein [Paenibacillus sp. 598K]|uniref:extracellular solute-binding protein n=1 Tax=Paenibacillus sp. 598K TaxID=1117987 RepID=UPI000FFAF9A1|nr:extracellular solute-binding protein [Paenibacillus sp. 598K]GBF75707.1 putative ABC transporter substrate-binding protein [Paenibacillus sp. 598K]
MKRKAIQVIPVMVLCMLIFLTGCTSNNGGNTPTPAPTPDKGEEVTTPAPEESGGEDDDKSQYTGTVKVLREWGEAQPNKAMFDALAIAFMEEYPNVKIQYVLDGGAGSLPTYVAANDSPDLVMTYSAMPHFLKDNLLEDLMPYMERDGTIGKDNYVDASYSKYVVDGKLYGLPWNVDPNFPLYHNKKILEQQGINEVPSIQTLEELGDYLEQFWIVNNGKQEMTSFDPSSIWGTATAFMTWSFLNGATAEEIYDPVTRKVGYNNPKIVEAMEWMADFYQRNVDAGRLDELKKTLPADTDLFDANKMAVSYAYTQKMRDEMDVLFTALPDESLWVGGYGFSMVSTAPNKESAFQFLKWLTTSESAARISYDILGVIPAQKSVPYLEELAKADPLLQLRLDIMSKVKKYPPLTPVSLPDTFEADFMAVLNGTSSEDPQSFLDNLTKTLQQQVDDYYK